MHRQYPTKDCNLGGNRCFPNLMNILFSEELILGRHLTLPPFFISLYLPTMTSFTHSFNFAIPDEGDTHVSSSSSSSSAVSSSSTLPSSSVSSTTISNSSSTSSSFIPTVPVTYGKLRQSYTKIHWGEAVGCSFNEGDIVYIHWSTSSPFELDVSKVTILSSSVVSTSSSSSFFSSSSSSTVSSSSYVPRISTTERNMVPIQHIQLLYTLRDKETQLTGIYTPDSSNCYIYDSVWPSTNSSTSSTASSTSFSSSSISSSSSSSSSVPSSSHSSSSSSGSNKGNIIIAPLVLDPGLGSYVWPLTKSIFLRQIYRNKGFCVHSTGSRLLQIQPDFHNFHVPTMIQYASRITVWMKNTRNQKMQYIDNVPPEIALACYRSGHSLYFNPSHDIQKKYLHALCTDLELNFGVSMLNDATPGGDIEIFAVQGKHSTPWHFDGQENFTVQLVGTKRWKFCPSAIQDPLTNLHPSTTNTQSIEDDKKVHRTYCTVPLDTKNVPGIRHYHEQEERLRMNSNHSSSKETPTPLSSSSITTLPSSVGLSSKGTDQVTTVVLRPGSVLYVPAGWWHAVDSEDEEGSLSINFSVSGGRWNDFFLRRFIQVLWNQSSWRERITVPNNNIQATREHFTALVKELPQVLHNLGQHSKSIGHAFLPDALFDQYKTKKIIIHEKDKHTTTVVSSLPTLTSSSNGTSLSNNSSHHDHSNKYPRYDDDNQTTTTFVHNNNINNDSIVMNREDNTHNNDDDGVPDDDGNIDDEDNEESEGTNNVLYSTQLPSRLFTSQTILYRNPLQIMVIKGGNDNPTLTVLPETRKRSRSSSSSSSSRPTGGRYIPIEIHSGFGSIAAESFLSDTVHRVYVPPHLLPLVQYMEKLSPYSNTPTTSATTTTTSSSSSLTLRDCFRLMKIPWTDQEAQGHTSSLDNYASIKGLLTTLCHTGYFHDTDMV